jgi:hypothetical protein
MTTNIADSRGMSTKFFGRNIAGVLERREAMIFRRVERSLARRSPNRLNRRTASQS